MSYNRGGKQGKKRDPGKTDFSMTNVRGEFPGWQLYSPPREQDQVRNEEGLQKKEWDSKLSDTFDHSGTSFKRYFTFNQLLSKTGGFTVGFSSNLKK